MMPWVMAWEKAEIAVSIITMRAIAKTRLAVELRSTGQPRAAVPTWAAVIEF